MKENKVIKTNFLFFYFFHETMKFIIRELKLEFIVLKCDY